jgi:hypothetical protein
MTKTVDDEYKGRWFPEGDYEDKKRHYEKLWSKVKEKLQRLIEVDDKQHNSGPGLRGVLNPPRRVSEYLASTPLGPEKLEELIPYAYQGSWHFMFPEAKALFQMRYRDLDQFLRICAASDLVVCSEAWAEKVREIAPELGLV